MEQFNDAEFWEFVAIAILFACALPFVFLIYVVGRILHDGWKSGAFGGEPQAQVHDNTFGDLRLYANSDWDGEIFFAPVSKSVMISVDAPHTGPSEEQRELARQIEARYDDVLPAILKLLHEYVASSFDAVDWEFELVALHIPANPDSQPWSAQYTANTDYDGDMGYFVDVLQWEALGIAAGD